MKITKIEQNALAWLKDRGGLISETELDLDEKDWDGCYVGFSQKTFNSLVKKGLIVFSEDTDGIFCGDYVLPEEISEL
jgi:hypothetical protein